jgi:hypothetical protein
MTTLTIEWRHNTPDYEIIVEEIHRIAHMIEDGIEPDDYFEDELEGHYKGEYEYNWKLVRDEED